MDLAKMSTPASPGRRYAYNPYSSTDDTTATSTANMSLMDLIAKDVQEFADKFQTSDYYDEHHSSAYSKLEKAKILQDARIFHDSIFVREHPRRCCTVMVQLLHLQDTDEKLNATEATEVFFGVTKLFMSDDPALRRIVYLFLKDMAENCDPSDVIIITSCLTKDMTCDVDLYRANALRVLAKVVDAAMLGAIERYVKQAIVDSSSEVSSAALISASHWFLSHPDCANIVKRWIRETQEAVKSRDEMIQYHAVQLMYQIKARDRLGVSKLVTQLSQKNLRSPLANVLLARYTGRLVAGEYDQGRDRSSPLSKTGYRFLESSLRHKSELVVYEAARAICSLPEVEPQDLSPAVSALQVFLSSPKPCVRFASVKTLAEVSNHHPRAVSKCNEDLEALIGDTNRSIGTLAITTLLKTGSEGNIDRLLRQISMFLTEITDEYKITVVKSLQQLCLIYPSRHRVLISFLSNFLREEGGYEFKKSIVDSIISLMRAVPETTESSLLHLCEFIEDCEFTSLSTQILILIADLGPKTSEPSRYIRFIYNRVMLEGAAVRAAAVTSLAKFASSVPSLRASVVPLLKRSLSDEDDETRDRAAVAISVLTKSMEENPYVDPAHILDAEEEIPPDVPAPNDSAALVFVDKMPVSFGNLERSLVAYLSIPQAMNSAEELSFSALPVIEDTATEVERPAINDAVNAQLSTKENGSLGISKKVDPTAEVYAIPELAALGRVFRSSPNVELTESETEYVVTCMKHVFPEHLVLQFKVQNTVEDQRLDDVRVSVECSEPDHFEVMGEISAESISYGSTESCFTLVKRTSDLSLAPAAFACEMHFTVVQVDSASGEEAGDAFEEEYHLEGLEVSTSDFMAKVPVGDFRRSWEDLGDTNEVTEKFALQFSNLEDAVSSVTKFLGMHPCDGTAFVKANARRKPHMLHLSGVFLGGSTVLARAQCALDPSSGVVLKIAVRSDDKAVSRLVADCIR